MKEFINLIVITKTKITTKMKDTGCDAMINFLITGKKFSLNGL